MVYSVLHIDQCIYTTLFFTLCYMQICVSLSFYSSQYVTCRSVYEQRSILHSVFLVHQCIYIFLDFHSVLPVDQCIFTILSFTLCYMQISVSTLFYFSLCVTHRSIYLNLSMLHSSYRSVYHSLLFVNLRYVQISVSTFFFSSICVTCRSVYLHLTMLHSMLYVEQCIYTLLFLKMCCIQISVSTSFLISLCVTWRPVYLHHSMLHCVT